MVKAVQNSTRNAKTDVLRKTSNESRVIKKQVDEDCDLDVLFDKLKTIIPSLTEKKTNNSDMTEVDIIDHAIDYIYELEDTLTKDMSHKGGLNQNSCTNMFYNLKQNSSNVVAIKPNQDFAFLRAIGNM